MTDTIATAEDDRRTLAAAPDNSDDWDDDAWAAWFRTAERAHGDRFDGDTKPARPIDHLRAIADSARHAISLTRAQNTTDATEHVHAIERLITAYHLAARTQEA